MANYKRSGGNALKVYAAIVSILLAAAIALTACAFALDWVKLPAQDEPVINQPDDELADFGGAVLGEAEANGISVMSASIAPADFEDYGVSALAETAYTVSVTPEPADAMDTYTWTCDNTQQIQLSPSSDTKSCTVSCTGAFGTQATITIASAVNPDITATVTVDYVKRVESVSISFGADKIKFGNSETTYTLTAIPTYGTGTITPEISITFFYFKYNIEVEDTVEISLKGNKSSTAAVVPVSGLYVEGNSLTVSTPADTFIESYSKSGTTPPPESSVNSVFNNSFTENSTGTTSDGTLTVHYKVSYTPDSDDVQGSFSDADAVTLGVAFDTSELVVNASTIKPSDSGLVY